MLILALLLAALPPLSLPAQSRTLENGLVVIVSPDHSAPGVAMDLRYHVGSKDEDPGRTGFAHLFEHLMFMGARHVRACSPCSARRSRPGSPCPRSSRPPRPPRCRRIVRA